MPEMSHISAALSQPFTFLDCGQECYAFASADGKLILKVFKHHHVRQAALLARLTHLPYFEKLAREKRERQARNFASCKLAYEELKDETGLIFAHLKKTSVHLPTVTLIDKLGIQHKVALDEIQFLVQRRAELLIPTLRTGTEHAKESITSLLKLISKRCEQGVDDRDPVLSRNYGFLDTRAIIIDVGSFSKKPHLMHPQAYKRELFYETLPLRCLLNERFPELVPHFEEELNKIVKNENKAPAALD
jgi:hypothetical protein